MPCQSYHDESSYWDGQRRKWDELVQLLCGLCGRIESEAALIESDEDWVDEQGTAAMLKKLITADEKLAAWWKEHKAKDAERIAKEQAEKNRKRLRRALIKKLTPEELDALACRIQLGCVRYCRAKSGERSKGVPMQPRIPAMPITPGEVLRDIILPKYGITQDQLADYTQVSRFTINQIINSHRNITPSMALRLARVTGAPAEFWLNLQMEVDLFKARIQHEEELTKLPSLQPTFDIKELH